MKKIIILMLPGIFLISAGIFGFIHSHYYSSENLHPSVWLEQEASVKNERMENLAIANTVQEAVYSIWPLEGGLRAIPAGEKCLGPGHNIAIGQRAGMTITTGGCNILIGHNTQLPTPDTMDFVNIGNILCFDRVTGEKLSCTVTTPITERLLRVLRLKP